MERQNVAEYKIIRKEIEAIKKCITDYMGFLLIGVGTSYSALGGIVAIKRNDIYYDAIAYSSLAISFIAISILYILLYKFISHNRYVGYCLLLNQEIWDQNDCRYDDIFIWELCLTLLRKSEIAKHAEVSQNDRISEEDKELDSILLKVKQQQASYGVMDDILFFIKSLLTIQKTPSWGFPTTIVRIIFIVILSSVGLCVYNIVPVFKKISPNNLDATIPIIVTALLFHLLLWYGVARKYHIIMKGHENVINFCSRFIPIRNDILRKNFDVSAKWSLFPDTQK